MAILKSTPKLNRILSRGSPQVLRGMIEHCWPQAHVTQEAAINLARNHWAFEIDGLLRKAFQLNGPEPDFLAKDFMRWIE